MPTPNSSFVVDVEKMLADDSAASRSAEGERWEKQDIYLVPEWLKGGNTQAYKPRLVSLGPFHHGDSNLAPMEEHKRRAVLHLVKRSNKPLEHFISAIKSVEKELVSAYGKDLDVKWRNNKQRFVEMMLTDGCFMLEAMWWRTFRDYELYDPVFSELTFRDYELSDPVFSDLGQTKIYDILKSDMLLLENQLPLLVLKKILGVVDPERTEDATEKNVNGMVLKFLGRFHEGSDIADMSLRPHPLELYHGSLTYSYDSRGFYSQSYDYEYEMMPSALEIHEAGIKFEKSEADKLLNICFERGVLRMPVLTVSDSTESLYLNLMAFERLKAGAGDLVTAYVIFMDNMIVTAKDVELLSSKEVLRNMLGCDEETAKLFNGTLSRWQQRRNCPGPYIVQCQLNKYCREPWHKWRATLIRTYFRNPWSFISLAAAVILLTATLVQTVYTVKS